METAVLPRHLWLMIVGAMPRLPPHLWSVIVDAVQVHSHKLQAQVHGNDQLCGRRCDRFLVRIQAILHL